MPPRPASETKPCLFCRIVAGEVDSRRVLEDEKAVAFLDSRPLLPGHVLLVPRRHVETIYDLPQTWLKPFFSAGKLLAQAVEDAMEADGTFLAINTHVSQSVPHLHLHLVPRWEGDGLFSPKLIWKRRPYRTDKEAAAIQRKIRHALAGSV